MSNLAFKVEKNFPLPPTSGGGIAKFPWNDMGVGDSFFVPGVAGGSLRSRASYLKKRGDGHFTVRAVDGGIRVWRVK